MTLDRTYLYINHETLKEALVTIEEAIETYGEDATIVEGNQIEYMRMETENEHNSRLIKEEMWEKQREEVERKKYEELKKKFG
jgi:ABC-type taurine transport system ATPase subunit